MPWEVRDLDERRARKARPRRRSRPTATEEREYLEPLWFLVIAAVVLLVAFAVFVSSLGSAIGN